MRCSEERRNGELENPTFNVPMQHDTALQTQGMNSFARGRSKARNAHVSADATGLSDVRGTR